MDHHNTEQVDQYRKLGKSLWFTQFFFILLLNGYILYTSLFSSWYYRSIIDVVLLYHTDIRTPLNALRNLKWINKIFSNSCMNSFKRSVLQKFTEAHPRFPFTPFRKKSKNPALAKIYQLSFFWWSKPFFRRFINFFHGINYAINRNASFFLSYHPFCSS